MGLTKFSSRIQIFTFPINFKRAPFFIPASGNKTLPNQSPTTTDAAPDNVNKQTA